MSLNTWQFFNPVEILFGVGSLNELNSVSDAKNILIVTTKGFVRRGIIHRISNHILADRNISLFDGVDPNPDLEALQASLPQVGDQPVEQIIAVGGGSVIDAAKIFSVLLAPQNYDFSLRNYLQEDYSKRHLSTLPIIAVPTTAGTGSEVTSFATVWDKLSKRKYSLSAKSLYPKIAIIDPSLTLSLPKKMSILTGLDALSHSFESLWNKNANPITKSYSLQALQILLANFSELVTDLNNLQIRSNMMQGSLLAGLAISQTRTAIAHSISYPLTIHYNVPHGLACGFILPKLLTFNSKADDGRLAQAASTLGYRSVEDLVTSLIQLFRKLEVKKLINQYLHSKKDILNLTSEMISPGRADNNLRHVDVQTLDEFFSKII